MKNHIPLLNTAMEVTYLYNTPLRFKPYTAALVLALPLGCEMIIFFFPSMFSNTISGLR